jgi:hypothetical protein
MVKEITKRERELLDARREEREALEAWENAKSTGIDLDQHHSRWLKAQERVIDLASKVESESD